MPNEMVVYNHKEQQTNAGAFATCHFVIARETRQSGHPRLLRRAYVLLAMTEKCELNAF